MPPDAFERLSQRVLREAGFVNVHVTGRPGDGGLDGTGIYRLSPLVSFPTFLRCKRYRGSVSPAHVRDFRGAMAGRGNKGLLITTGTFSKEARNEATRDGAQPIELTDGSMFCDRTVALGGSIVGSQRAPCRRAPTAPGRRRVGPARQGRGAGGSWSRRRCCPVRGSTGVRLRRQPEPPA